MTKTTAIKERPILFSGPMVRAILDGHKTQTRRVIKPQPGESYSEHYENNVVVKHDSYGWSWSPDSYKWPVQPVNSPAMLKHCPYGQPGDRLWVRETWQYYDWTEDGQPFIRYKSGGAAILRENVPDDWIDRLTDVWAELSAPANYNIDGRAADRSWRPSIFMPRWASGITLEIVDVRAERLHSITEEDAIAEGVQYWDGEVWDGYTFYSGHELPPLRRFAALWDVINLKRGYSWQSNPWVWEVTFRVLEQEAANAR